MMPPLSELIDLEDSNSAKTPDFSQSDNTSIFVKNTLPNLQINQNV